MKNLLSTRNIFFLIAGICLVLILIALYMQEQLEMHPCPLCITQRVFVILAGVVALIAALHNPAKLFRKFYALLCGIFCVIGGGVSARHVWLQNLPEDQVPACGPGLGYMFNNLPFVDALNLLFAGDGNCADVVWTFLSLSIPAWTLVAFGVLFLMSVVQFFRSDAVPALTKQL